MKLGTKFLNPQGLVLMVCPQTQKVGNKMPPTVHCMHLPSTVGTKVVTTHQRISSSTEANDKNRKYYAYNMLVLKVKTNT